MYREKEGKKKKIKNRNERNDFGKIEKLLKKAEKERNLTMFILRVRRPTYEIRNVREHSLGTNR